MKDPRLYLEEPALESVETVITGTGEEDGAPFVELRETVFHPEGGGQPADSGTINGVEVTDVRSSGDRIRHFLADPLPPGEVLARIDAARRFDYRQQHSAQHLLTALLLDRHGLPTTAFHLGRDYVAIEVDGPVPSPGRLAEWEVEVNREIRADRAVRTRWVEPGDLEALGVRSRGLPADHQGAVRLVEIDGIDLNTCGGTHVSRLSEIQVVHLLDAVAARGGARIRFLAGGRVLDLLRANQERETRLKSILAAGPDDFAGILEGWIEERKRTAKQIKALEADLAVHQGGRLAAVKGPEISAHLGTGGPAFLKAVAAEVFSLRPDVVVLLTAEDPASDSVCFLVQSGPAGPEDVSEVGAGLRDRLGARGGGKGRFFQGAGGHRDALKNGPETR